MSRNRLDCNAVIKRVIEHFEHHPGVPLDAETKAHLQECRACHGRAELERRARVQAGGLSCEEVIEMLFAYLDREVGDELTDRIEQHLESCRDCFSRVEFEKRLRAKVRASGEVQAPARLHKRIKIMLDEFGRSGDIGPSEPGSQQ